MVLLYIAVLSFFPGLVQSFEAFTGILNVTCELLCVQLIASTQQCYVETATSAGVDGLCLFVVKVTMSDLHILDAPSESAFCGCFKFIDHFSASFCSTRK